MLVRMKVNITGHRNGEPWPAVGETIELPDHEAADMLANRYVEEVRDAPAAEEGDEGTAGEDSEDAAEEGDEDAAAAPQHAEVRPVAAARKRSK